jgi:very-short-patch-repair endonuclease
MRSVSMAMISVGGGVPWPDVSAPASAASTSAPRNYRRRYQRKAELSTDVVHRGPHGSRSAVRLFRVTVRPVVPARLRDVPFRGSTAVEERLLTRGQLAGPSWRRLFPDIYVHIGVPVDHFTRCEAAALLLPPGAAIAGRSAAIIFRAAVSGPTDPPVEVAVASSTSMRRHAGLRLGRTRLDPGDVMSLGALPVTTPVRTAFDLARRPGLTEAVVAVDALLRASRLTVPDLARYADERVGWPRTRQLGLVLRLAAPGAESPMETRLRLLLVLGGLPPPVVQYPLPAANARLDLAYPQVKVAVEYDGDHHRERRQFQHDVTRLNRIRLLGWTVLRFTADDILRRPERVLAQVRRALGPDLLRHRAPLGQ